MGYMRKVFKLMVFFGVVSLLLCFLATKFEPHTLNNFDPEMDFSNFNISSQNVRILDIDSIAQQYYGPDWEWFKDSIPFFEIDHEAIQQIYYYRWHLLKMHIRDIGQSYVITEFTPNVPWATHVTSTINAAAGHHIYEGRWLRNRRYFDDYVDYWFNGVPGIKDFDTRLRQYSFWISNSLLAYYEANLDLNFTRKFYDQAKHNFEAWINERFDNQMNMFWQVPVLDGSEFSVSGIEVNDGWQGDSYRPSINSYMYGESKALAFFARLFKDVSYYRYYLRWENHIRKMTEKKLWDTELQHFVDRFQLKYPERNTSFNGYRELMGFIPWTFNLPKDIQEYDAAWVKLNDTQFFRGNRGLRTVEKTFPQYLTQYRENNECQWNGFSWPFHTSFVLDAMSNILNKYRNIKSVTKDLYFDQFQLYTQQQYKNNKPYTGENIQPDVGGWYSDYQNRSEHYFHSQYINLLVTGLIGLRPRHDNILEINPLISENNTRYFILQNLPYHGYNVTILYDSVNRYNSGNGFQVYLNDVLLLNITKLRKIQVKIPNPPADFISPPLKEHNLALNIQRDRATFPLPSASYSPHYVSPYDAIDGYVWNETFPYNQWNCLNSNNTFDWYEIDFGKIQQVYKVAIYFLDNQENIKAPKSYRIQYLGQDGFWKDSEVVQAFAGYRGSFVTSQVRNQGYDREKIIGGTLNVRILEPFQSTKIRGLFENQGQGYYTGISEFQVY